MKLKKKIEFNAAECERRNREIKEQRDIVFRHCTALKARMQGMRAAENKRLTELCLMSRAALKANQEKLAKAETLLELAELARKLETEREKILPFYDSVLDKAQAAAQAQAAEAQAASFGVGLAGAGAAGAGAAAAAGAGRASVEAMVAAELGAQAPSLLPASSSATNANASYLAAAKVR